MIRLALYTYTFGLVTGLGLVLGGALYLGPEVIVQTGLRYEAALTTYAFDARPVVTVDEADVVAFIEDAKPKRRK